MRKKREAYRYLLKNLKERDRLEDPGIERVIFKREGVAGLIWYKNGTRGRLP
jgi:hypothetical protein